MKTVLISGSASTGKTALIKHLAPWFAHTQQKLALCKIDCLATADDQIYESLGVPYVVGLSKDVCPDHFLVSNMYELDCWAKDKGADVLLIETAGLCHRCSPATNKTLHICVLDCTANFSTPHKLGPMLTESDAIILTKADMISQAEREIIVYRLRELHSTARIFFVDGIVGYGAELVARYINDYTPPGDDVAHKLRYSMPSGVCSYCIGEVRIGAEYQQGIVSKIDFNQAQGGMQHA